ncbi:acetyl-CoA hydrolase/transferase family protein [Nocardioides sp. NPDC087217]|uniref:acetyl-CoA hydrolase/transferase family protein n=1 Tax=Nocardioides sp. NPDC087217 TaxID=3364335 RepID=UPI0038054262
MTIDLTAHVRPGDTVVWGQMCAEPRTLTRALMEQAPVIGALRCFVGIPAASSVTVETVPDEVEVHSYCGSGSNATLHAAGRLQVWPVHYSDLPALLTAGPLHADVVLVQVSEPDEHGRHSLGLADDYFSAALDTARVVIAEISPQVPRTPGARTLTAADWAAAVVADDAPAEVAVPRRDETTLAVARQVAALIPDGATLQFGIGALPEAVLGELFDRRDLGIHSGLFTDAAMRLVEAGVATGVRKRLDTGVAVAGLLGGSAELFAWADHNPAVSLRPTSYTHEPEVLAAMPSLVAVNAALEVDLTGQINAEEISGRYVGAVGGAVDFLRGAARSEGGLPVVALPSQVEGHSTIVPRLSGPVSTPRSEQVVVVTEQGVADLRGTTLAQRTERLIAIAHPTHRAALEQAADGVLAAAV